MPIKEALITSAVTAVAIPSVFVGTCLGTLFAPALAAGSIGFVMGATLVGLKIAFLPTVFFSGMAALSSKPVTQIGFSVLAAGSLIGGIALGGALFGLSLQTLMPCIGLGVAIAALGALIITGLAKLCLNTLMEELKETPEPSKEPMSCCYSLR